MSNLPDVPNRDLEENVLAQNANPVTDRLTEGANPANAGSVRASHNMAQTSMNQSQTATIDIYDDKITYKEMKTIKQQ